MLRHLHNKSKTPRRVVVLGANGFIGSSTIQHLLASGVNTLPLTRNDVDLLSTNAALSLSEILTPQDSLLFISARAPVKNNQMLTENITIATNVCEALSRTPVSHLIYISSDAVYSDDSKPLTESSSTAPDSLHGVMHLTREVMLTRTVETPTCILRPTLIYGPSDPHNGYGPNRFIRQALAGEAIRLFGHGEERRDHVWIDDVAAAICHTLFHKSVGQLNVCSGHTVSFEKIAKMILTHIGNVTAIEYLPRVGPIPHNGFRAFDTSFSIKALPDFKPVPPLEGIRNCIEDFRRIG